ncbi:uncharacterized protein LOC134856438, partial [Symsagittifera roscoffensis]|uniref:uncharacterized protein LOC134856438 n=1 Tax=Symsagittifera roscoffensis TaxID=84072 RepID=UPI00307B8C18
MPRNDNSFFREPLDGELSDDLDGGGFDDNFGNSGDFNDIGLDDGLARSRPGTATSVLFQANDDTNMAGYTDPNADPPPSSAPSQNEPRNPTRVVKFAVYLVILLAVVAMCMLSAFMSISTLLQTKDIPATTYKQKKQTGPHKHTGIIFMAKGLDLITCETFNFTSLNIDELFKRPLCQERQFTLHYYDEIPFYLESSLHEMLQYVRKEQSQLTAVLIRGPADWGNKQTTIAHVTVPLDQAGTWSVIHPDFDELSDRFAASSFEGAMTHLKWELSQDLLDGGYSMNPVSSNFRTLFLMSENVFMNFGNVDAIRFEMEISLMESNKSALDRSVRDRRGGGTDLTQLQHIEVLYQWKDNYFMLGDS